MLEDESFRIQAFIIDESKFDFFFGRVTSTPGNQARSLQNLYDLSLFGIREQEEGRERLIQLFQEGLTAPEGSPRKENRYGVTISRVVQIESDSVRGEIEIGYFYRDGDLSRPPKITTIIPRIYR